MGERTTAVEFAGNMRVHVSFGVSDLEKAVEFYTLLWGQEPTKRRPGYAKFEVEEPSINFSLTEDPSAKPTTNRGNNHFGIQVRSSSVVQAMHKRLVEGGQETLLEEGTDCCYALQDKVWVRDPEGHPWEIFVVLENEGEMLCKGSSTCNTSSESLPTTKEQSCCEPAPANQDACCTPRSSMEPCCEPGCC